MDGITRSDSASEKTHVGSAGLDIEGMSNVVN
jgi:hypothetical protein